jgi:hypothetical protein
MTFYVVNIILILLISSPPLLVAVTYMSNVPGPIKQLKLTLPPLVILKRYPDSGYSGTSIEYDVTGPPKLVGSGIIISLNHP